MIALCPINRLRLAAVNWTGNNRLLKIKFVFGESPTEPSVRVNGALENRPAELTSYVANHVVMPAGLGIQDLPAGGVWSLNTSGQVGSTVLQLTRGIYVSASGNLSGLPEASLPLVTLSLFFPTFVRAVIPTAIGSCWVASGVPFTVGENLLDNPDLRF